MKNMFKPTTYMVLFWNKDESEVVGEEVYLMHLFSFNDVVELLRGKEDMCDIYESRFSKRSGKYITVGNVYTWKNGSWVLQI